MMKENKSDKEIGAGRNKIQEGNNEFGKPQ